MPLQEKITEIGRICNFHDAAPLWIFVFFLTVYFLRSHIEKRTSGKKKQLLREKEVQRIEMFYTYFKRKYTVTALRLSNKSNVVLKKLRCRIDVFKKRYFIILQHILA